MNVLNWTVGRHLLLMWCGNKHATNIHSFAISDSRLFVVEIQIQPVKNKHMHTHTVRDTHKPKYIVDVRYTFELTHTCLAVYLLIHVHVFHLSHPNVGPFDGYGRCKQLPTNHINVQLCCFVSHGQRHNLRSHAISCITKYLPP